MYQVGTDVSITGIELSARAFFFKNSSGHFVLKDAGKEIDPKTFNDKGGIVDGHFRAKLDLQKSGYNTKLS